MEPFWRGRALCAPSLIDYEIADVALNKLRSRTLARDAVQHALDIYAEFEIHRWDIDRALVVRIGEDFGLSVYDASYVWLAGYLRVPLATFDARVAAAAYLKRPPPPS